MLDEVLLNWVAVVCAFIAALFWFCSASTRLPKEITIGFGGSGGSAQELGDKLRLQSRFSAIAAVFAGIAAAAQAITLMH